MTYFTGLARVAKTTGYKVVEVAGWKTRGQGQMGTVKTIVAHHTAGAKTGNYPSLNVVAYGRAGLRGALSHYGIGRDGTIYVIAAGLTWHAGKVSKTAHANAHAIGIEAENTGVGQVWPAAQLDSYVKLCAALVKEFGLDVSDVLGHKEIAPNRKIDPNFSGNGIDMGDFRAAIKRGYYTAPKATIKPASSAKPKAKAPAKKKAAPKAWPNAKLKVTSAHTAASHAAWVELMELCGFTDKSLSVNLQRWLANQKGVIGRRYYTGLIDGDFYGMSVEALQTFLVAKGHLPNRKYIDRDRGARTIRAEIAYLNAQIKEVK